MFLLTLLAILDIIDVNEKDTSDQYQATKEGRYNFYYCLFHDMDKTAIYLNQYDGTEIILNLNYVTFANLNVHGDAAA